MLMTELELRPRSERMQQNYCAKHRAIKLCSRKTQSSFLAEFRDNEIAAMEEIAPVKQSETHKLATKKKKTKKSAQAA
jgi:hypothetical protein